MKRFSEIQKRAKIRRINENEANLPENYEDMSKEELQTGVQGTADGIRGRGAGAAGDQFRGECRISYSF